MNELIFFLLSLIFSCSGCGSGPLGGRAYGSNRQNYPREIMQDLDMKVSTSKGPIRTSTISPPHPYSLNAWAPPIRPQNACGAQSELFRALPNNSEESSDCQAFPVLSGGELAPELAETP